MKSKKPLASCRHTLECEASSWNSFLKYRSSSSLSRADGRLVRRLSDRLLVSTSESFIRRRQPCEADRGRAWVALPDFGCQLGSDPIADLRLSSPLAVPTVLL